MADIKIKNFGPIKEATITIKKVNVFIGPTSTGKSTVAKLIAIFNTLQFIQNPSYGKFASHLIYYNISFPFTEETYIEYRLQNFYWRISGKILETNFNLNGVVSIMTLSEYMPAYSPSSIDDSINYSRDQQFLMPLLLLDPTDIKKIRSELETLTDNNIKEQLTLLVEKLMTVRNEIAHNGYMSSVYPYYVLTEFFKIVKDEIDISDPIYIPAERITMAMVAESIFGLLKNDVSLPACVKDFGAKFETARRGVKEVSIGFFDIAFYQKNNSNVVRLANGEEIRLEQASSGFQSLIPMFTVIDYFVRQSPLLRNTIIIEEPELNLYPSAQKDFIEFLIKKNKAPGNKLFITTHSPYVLTALDNLIQADNAVLHNQQNTSSVADIIEQDLWLKFSDVSCYYFSGGTCKSTLDEENQSIGASNIDDVSIDLGKIFDQLLELKYN